MKKEIQINVPHSFKGIEKPIWKFQGCPQPDNITEKGGIYKGRKKIIKLLDFIETKIPNKEFYTPKTGFNGLYDYIINECLEFGWKDTGFINIENDYIFIIAERPLFDEFLTIIGTYEIIKYNITINKNKEEDMFIISKKDFYLNEWPNKHNFMVNGKEIPVKKELKFKLIDNEKIEYIIKKIK